MNMSQALQDSGAIDSMAQQFGIDRATALQAANAMLPAIVAGMGRDHVGAGDSRDGGGLGSILGGALGGGGGLLEDVLSPGETNPAPGNDILGQIFGSKDVSRGVAEEAAGITGLPAVLLKRMLPVLVMAVVGYAMRGGFSKGAEAQSPDEADAVPHRRAGGAAGRGAGKGAGRRAGAGAGRRVANGGGAGGMGNIGRAVLGGIIGRVVAGAVRRAI